jgi:hypothetical protein
MTQYLANTDVVHVVNGQLGHFRGSITATTLSSNETAWRVELRFDGKTETVPKIHATNVLEVPYPQAAQFAAPGIGTVTGRFLSDGEINDFEKR